MASEQHKAALRRFYDEVIGQGRLEVIDELIAPDFVDHEEQNPSHDRAGLTQMLAQYVSAFPDVRAQAEDLLAEGDRVVARVVVTGTHRGAFMGTAPTGKPFAVTCIDILRFADGKAVEHWSVFDRLGMLQQLGVIPVPDAASA